MSEELAHPKSGRFIHVEAQEDHLESLAKGRPASTLAELIWNALDADADEIRIRVQDNELGSPSEIEVADNGNGITPSEAERAFGSLGGSWKKNHRFTTRSKKKMHGRDGKGRFKAFALGHDVAWDTAYFDENNAIKRYSIRGQANRLQSFEIEEAKSVTAGISRGTRVKITNVHKSLGGLSADGSTTRQLAEIFALYLRNYPSTHIVFRDTRVDPAAVQKSHTSIELPLLHMSDGKEVKSALDIVEWTFAKKERRIYLCDGEGFALHEVEAGIRPGSEYNFTAYLRSDLISKLHAENALALDEFNVDLRRLIEDARASLRAYFRRRKAETASELVQQWKDEGVYPFMGDASDSLEVARREVFDICALNVHQYVDSFRDGPKKDRQFTLRMLKAALDENPEALKRILTDVLDMPKERQSELADLLQYTTLSAIIEASKMVADRLQFLAGLHELLFKPELKQTLKERTQLHRMLEGETWIFGEEYLLTSSDENLNTVLRKHLDKLRPNEKRSKKQKSVLRDDGSQAVIDMLLGRELPAYAQTRREYLVVELKRPNQKIDLEVKSQIESYALAIASDERFDKQNTYWTFLAISNEITDDAERTVRQQGKAFGFFHDEPQLKIGLATWSQILGASRARLEAFRRKLDYTATKDQGIALLHSKYAQYLPPTLQEVAVYSESESTSA